MGAHLMVSQREDRVELHEWRLCVKPPPFQEVLNQRLAKCLRQNHLDITKALLNRPAEFSGYK